MNEAEWLSSTEPGAMLRWLTGSGTDTRQVSLQGVSDRKLRLFACACCRQVWHLLTDDAPCPSCSSRPTHLRDAGDAACHCGGTGRINRSHKAVKVAERYADGEATEDDLVVIRQSVEGQILGAGIDNDPNWGGAWTCCTPEMMAGDGLPHILRLTTVSPATQAALLRCVVGNPWRPVVLLKRCPLGYANGLLNDGRCAACGRDPACPWLTPTVLALAQAAYEERLPEKVLTIPTGVIPVRPPGTLDPDRLAVLADALEHDTNCDNAELLAHLRSPGPHVRGCWVVDLLTGRA